MIDSKVPLKALQKQVVLLEQDLTPTGLADARLKVEWRAAKNADRTAATFETWLGERVTQVAVAWVLGTVFLRFCEDNHLIEYPFITGPGERADLARDLQAEYFQKHPEQTDRDWIIAGFDAMSVSPVAKGLFDRRHNPMWTIQPSHDAAKTLLAFWRETSPDGNAVYDLTDPEWDTRFLGDLYQDLSEAARKTYALLQTPKFIEEFILKYTLDPAIEEFGLTPAPPPGHEDLPHRLRVIDPACGSGHFLLGAFRKLLTALQAEKPGGDKWESIREALDSVHGVDKNPFAIAIARFRLMLAAMRAGGVERLSEQVDFPLNIAIGDSLLHGKGAPGRQVEFDFGGETSTHSYRTEDVEDFIKSVHILEVGTYHVVVANPPYITVKDKAENENYRKAYEESCAGRYALSVPFVERIFRLAIRDVGYTGQITANSFMKREFGRRLIENYFQTVDLTHIIDTSGAYIPGHSTPTVILFGRRRSPKADSTVRAVLGIRGEPTQPSQPEKGLVWQAVIGQVDYPGSESEWLSVSDAPRDSFASYPWTIGGGGVGELMDFLERDDRTQLKSYLRAPIGFSGFSANDEVFDFSEAWHRRFDTPSFMVRPLVAGKDIKSWSLSVDVMSIVPYDDKGNLLPINTSISWAKHFWMAKRSMGEAKDFSGLARHESGLPWWSWYRWIPTRNGQDNRVVIAKIATHNEAALNSGNAVTNQHAFVIQLTSQERVDLSYDVLALLNSSTTCFWLKQVCHDKGNGGYGGGIASEDWERGDTHDAAGSAHRAA